MSGLDITPLIPQGRQLIQGYGDGGFRVAGIVHTGSIFILPDRTLAWPVTSADAVAVDSMPAAEIDGTDILLVGCGDRFVAPPPSLRADLKALGVVLEWMDTGAACRTFNVLLAEDRRVAAALIAVS
jgi:uncharacterized protein